MTDLSPRQKRALAQQWGEALRRLRERARLKQIEAAAKLDLDQSAYSKYESGDRFAILNVDFQRRVSVEFGFAPDALEQEFNATGQEASAAPAPGNPFLPQSPLVFPLVGRARAGIKNQDFFNEEDLGEYDFGRVLDRHTKLVRVTGTSMVPVIEDGSIVAIDTNGYPKRGKLALIILETGAYFVKKFVRMTETDVHCIEMEELDFNGRQAFAERPVVYPRVEIRAIYPATLSIDES